MECRCFNDSLNDSAVHERIQSLPKSSISVYASLITKVMTNVKKKYLLRITIYCRGGCSRNVSAEFATWPQIAVVWSACSTAISMILLMHEHRSFGKSKRLVARWPRFSSLAIITQLFSIPMVSDSRNRNWSQLRKGSQLSESDREIVLYSGRYADISIWKKKYTKSSLLTRS